MAVLIFIIVILKRFVVSAADKKFSEEHYVSNDETYSQWLKVL